jgi:carbon monoxide dehydrogenase subunit G
MDFRIDAVLPASAAQLWTIFFDVQRVAGLIPGCEGVTEVEPLKEFSAVMKQKIGPFKLEVPTRIVVGAHTLERHVELSALGRDKFTGTSIDVKMSVNLDEQSDGEVVSCKMGVAAEMNVAGRLASLGYPIVKKRSEELFAEFERRLRDLLSRVDSNIVATASQVPTIASRVVRDESVAAPIARSQASPPQSESSSASGIPEGAVPVRWPAPLASSSAQASTLPTPPTPRKGRVELVLLWPRLGITLSVGVIVAHGAAAFNQSPWWWLVAPLLGVAAGLGRRGD